MIDGGAISFDTDSFYVSLSGTLWDAWERRAPLIEWLNDYDSQGLYYVGGTGIYFNQHEDAVIFKLRWT